ncbi:MAG: hypothetical protein GTN65_00895, partial [Armatimonadetes bacterium]|nr:hypothetical protein [Armatimonadota bacterium]NIO95673.1 hypothetical protein [Armatimonadota bacterium]
VPTAYIDSADPRYHGKTRPEIIAGGKPITLLYRAPSMFSVDLKVPGEKQRRAELTVAT